MGARESLSEKSLKALFYMLKTLRISEHRKDLCSPGTCILVKGEGDGRGTEYKTALIHKW